MSVSLGSSAAEATRGRSGGACQAQRVPCAGPCAAAAPAAAGGCSGVRGSAAFRPNGARSDAARRTEQPTPSWGPLCLFLCLFACFRPRRPDVLLRQRRCALPRSMLERACKRARGREGGGGGGGAGGAETACVPTNGRACVGGGRRTRAASSGNTNASLPPLHNGGPYGTLRHATPRPAAAKRLMVCAVHHAPAAAAIRRVRAGEAGRHALCGARRLDVCSSEPHDDGAADTRVPSHAPPRRIASRRSASNGSASPLAAHCAAAVAAAGACRVIRRGPA
jgi:hypothetical protein